MAGLCSLWSPGYPSCLGFSEDTAGHGTESCFSSAQRAWALPVQTEACVSLIQGSVQ